MNDAPSELAPQSFVIRLWQASPQQWRGTIRHVQSGAQRGFTRLEQAVAFIEQRAEMKTAKARRMPFTFDWGGLSRRQMRLAWVTGGALALVLLVVVLLANPQVNTPLSGAAIGAGSDWMIPLAFLVGGVVGGFAVGLWSRFGRC